jgi:hypothetical protein
MGMEATMERGNASVAARWLAASPLEAHDATGPRLATIERAIAESGGQRDGVQDVLVELPGGDLQQRPVACVVHAHAEERGLALRLQDKR